MTNPIPGHERFVGMLAIPYLTPHGPVAMKFRRLEGGGPKYDSPSGNQTRLYNAQALAPGGALALVIEGELGCIIGQSALGVPVVGTPGTTWLDHWARCFGDFDRVVVVPDHDAKEDGSDPGLAHGKKVTKSISGAEMVTPPTGLDFDEWIQRDGADAVKEAVGL